MLTGCWLVLATRDAVSELGLQDHGLSVDDFEETNEGLLKLLDVGMS